MTKGNNMNFWDSIKSSLYKYVEFTGRASRLEFWYFQIFLIILFLISMVLDYSINPAFLDSSEFGPAYIIVGIIFILPSLSLAVRRLRDINKSWLWAILFLVADFVLVLFEEEEFLDLESVGLTMMDYFVISSLVIWVWSIYWLGFKKSK